VIRVAASTEWVDVGGILVIIVAVHDTDMDRPRITPARTELWQRATSSGVGFANAARRGRTTR